MSKFCGEREVPASKFWGAFGWGEFADVEFVETGCAMLLAEELPKGCFAVGVWGGRIVFSVYKGV